MHHAIEAIDGVDQLFRIPEVAILFFPSRTPSKQVKAPEKREGKVVYDETDREVVKAANELSRFGVGARNMRVFRTSADRESNLLEAVLGSSLRSRNPDRRKEALESLESLAATVSHLKHLLLVRDLRRLAGN